MTTKELRKYELREKRKRATAGRTPTQIEKIDQAAREVCPASPKLGHWIPPTVNYCVRMCGFEIGE